MGCFALPVTCPQCVFNRCPAGESGVIAAAELGKRERRRLRKRRVIELSPGFSALWRGYGRWILRRNADDGSPRVDFTTATVNEQATETVRGACPHDCPDTCAMLVSVRDGRAVEERGDPEHPFTRGGLCVKVNNYVDKAYSPDRVLCPMRRTGPKGSGQFTRVSWDEALDEIAGRFRSE